MRLSEHKWGWRLMILGVFSTAQIYGIQSYSQDTAQNATLLATLKSKAPDTKTGHYLRADWRRGSMLLFSAQRIDNVLFKYDMEEKQFEIKHGEGTKLLEGYKVKSFYWVNKVGKPRTNYVNAVSFDSEKWLEGFFEILSKGKLSYYLKESLVLKSETHSTTYERIIFDEQAKAPARQEDLYLGQGSFVAPAPTRKKAWLKQFDNHADKVASFAKQQKLAFNNTEDMAKILDYFNQL